MAPVALVGVFSFMVASIFLGLLDTAILSLLTCVAIDMDNNDGTPMNGPPTFHDGGLDKFESAEQQKKRRAEAGFEDHEGGDYDRFEEPEKLGYEKFRESWIYKFMY